MSEKSNTTLIIKHEYNKELYVSGGQNLPMPFEVIQLGNLSKAEMITFVQDLKSQVIPTQSCVSKLKICETQKHFTTVNNDKNVIEYPECTEYRLKINVTQNIKNKGGLRCSSWTNGEKSCEQCLKTGGCHDEFMQRVFMQKFFPEKFKEIKHISHR